MLHEGKQLEKEGTKPHFKLFPRLGPSLDLSLQVTWCLLRSMALFSKHNQAHNQADFISSVSFSHKTNLLTLETYRSQQKQQENGHNWHQGSPAHQTGTRQLCGKSHWWKHYGGYHRHFYHSLSDSQLEWLVPIYSQADHEKPQSSTIWFSTCLKNSHHCHDKGAYTSVKMPYVVTTLPPHFHLEKNRNFPQFCFRVKMLQDSPDVRLLTSLKS